MRPACLVPLAALTLLLACEDTPTQPKSTAPAFALLGNVRVPVTLSGVTCDSDLVEGSGVGNFHNTATQDATGTLHVTNHSTFIGGAVAQQSGASYQFSFIDNLSINLPTFPAHFTEVMHLNLIGQGQASDLVGQSLLHITVDANGVVTASVDKFRVSCPG